MGLPLDQKMVVEATEHHFEGFEKRLEVEFQPLLSNSVCERRNLRDLTRDELDNMLTAAQCTIVSQMSNEHLDSYVLSESSLFVYPYCIVIKTCGTTKPLNALPLLLTYASQLSLKVTRCKYTRGMFFFPEDQPFPHSNFSHELAFLDTHFGQHLVSKSYVLRDSLQQKKWHIYSGIAAECSSSSPVHTIEMCMTGLNHNCAAKFFKATCSTAAEMTQESRIAEILPASSVNDFAFDPCGYSMNGIEGLACSTIHITPEDGFSYASFEAMGYNPSNMNMENLVERVLNCFKPAVFTLSVHLMGSTTGSNSWGSFVHPLGYGCNSSRKETLPGGSAVVYQAFQHLPPTDIEFLPLLYTPKMKKQYHETLDDVYMDAALHDIDDKSLDVNLKMGEMLWRLWKKWRTVLPRVQPFYTIRENPGREILSTLSSLGAGFAVASQLELHAVLKLGIHRTRIKFHNPCNNILSLDVREAGKHGVHLTTFHSALDLDKLKELNPHVEAILCIGVEEENEWGAVLKTARMLGMKMTGIAFNVESEENAETLIVKGIKQAKAVYDAALALGLPPLRLLDISAVAFANANKSLFESAADAMNTALDTYFPQSLGVTVIAEAGRFFGAEKKHVTYLRLPLLQEIACRRKEENPAGICLLTLFGLAFNALLGGVLQHPLNRFRASSVCYFILLCYGFPEA